MPGEKARPIKRRNFFIKKDFQARFILRFSLLILIGSVISTGLLFYFSRGTLTSSFYKSRLVVQTTAEAILPAVLATNLITFIIISLASIAVCLFVSHKIAGPLFRFEKDIKSIGEGDLTLRIHLRQKDQLVDLVRELNTMTGGLHARITGLRDQLADLIASAGEQGVSDSLIVEMKRMQAGIEDNYRL